MLGLFHHLFHPTNCYALCAVARSGAHLLCEGLRATRLAGRPLQYFHHQLAQRYADRYGFDSVQQFAHYVRGVVSAAATRNGVFGFKIEAPDLDPFIQRLRESGHFGPADRPEIELLTAAFPSLRCIQLTRQDKLRQAISKARAMQTDLWVVKGEKKTHRQPEFDPKLIRHCLLSAERSEQRWRDFFQRNGISPLEITYEELCADYPGTVMRVLRFLHIRPPRDLALARPATVRQADKVTEEWVGKYLALISRQ